MKLNETLNPQKLQEAINDGYISVRERENGLKILCYTAKTQLSGAWNSETMQARGLVVRVHEDNYEDATIIARGLPKFFTLQQHESGWGLFDDDENVNVSGFDNALMDTPCVAYDKVDGAMVGAFIEGKEIITFTKGSFQSDEAIGAKKVIDSRPDLQKLIRKMDEIGTPIFEFVTKEYRHVINYGDITDLFYLGVVLDDGVFLPNGSDPMANCGFGVRSAKEIKINGKSQMPLRDFLSITDGEGEGFVIHLRDGSHRMMKVKFDSYYEKRKIRYFTASIESIVERYGFNEVMSWNKAGDIPRWSEDIADDLHPIFQQSMWDKYGERFVTYRNLMADAEEFARKHADLDQKEYALAVKESGRDSRWMGAAFVARKVIVGEKEWKAHVVRMMSK